MHPLSSLTTSETLMKNWLRFFERRSLANPSPEILQLFNGGPTAAGMSVNSETALQVPAVFACCQVLAQDVARTPVKFRRRIAEDTYVDATDHDLFEILGTLPNPEQTSYQFKHTMQWSLLTHGRAYAEVVRIDGRVASLWPLDPRHMRVDRDDQRRKRWTYSAGGKTTTWTFNPSMPPIFELVHETPMHRCRELIGTALALQQYVGRFFSNGARPAGALVVPQALPEASRKSLRDSWNSTFGKVENSHKIAILDGGVDYKAFAQPNDQSQLNETMMAVSTSIAAAWRIAPWKVGIVEKTSYSNMATSMIDHVNNTLDPFYQCWEDAIRRDLLTNRQFNQFTALFDRNALIRSDVEATHRALATGIQNGVFSQNDARKALGLNPIPDGDRYLVNSALIPIADAGNENNRTATLEKVRARRPFDPDCRACANALEAVRAGAVWSRCPAHDLPPAA
jgi:HK97 family phage portal protein